MKVAVVGAGAIGAYVGAALHRGGAEVHLLARGAHLAAMRERGVTVLSPRGDFHAHPHATDDPASIGPVDIVFLGLKAYSYADAGPLLAPLLRPGTGVVAAQNGIPWWYFHGLPGPYAGRRVEAVDPGGVVSAVIPPEAAVGCVVYCSAEIASPGVIRHVEGTRFSIGEPSGVVSPRCVEFSEAMVAGGLKCPVVPDLRSDIWLKLLGNVAFNPVSVLTRATMGSIARASGDAGAGAEHDARDCLDRRVSWQPAEDLGRAAVRGGGEGRGAQDVDADGFRGWQAAGDGCLAGGAG